MRESHYQSLHSRFDLFRHPDMPDWRKPQLGALAAVLAQWSIDPTERVLISMPTGSGKSAVATALPYVARARRTLVLVPSVELRNQMHRAFAAEHVLRSIGALGNSALKPVVEVVRSRKIEWSRLSTADVVIALPNSGRVRWSV